MRQRTFFEMPPYSFTKQECRCPYCSDGPSKGEKIIAGWLEKNVIIYRKGCLPNRSWRYDFIIPSQNLFVEVQGIQHTEESYFHEIGGRTLE